MYDFLEIVLEQRKMKVFILGKKAFLRLVMQVVLNFHLEYVENVWRMITKAL